MRNPVVFVALAVLLGACSTVSIENRPSVLPSEFLANASRIEVTGPIRRFRPSFFNVEVGQSRVKNTRIGSEFQERLSLTGEKTLLEDYAWWNLLENGRLDTENLSYEQFRTQKTKEFSFGLAGAEHSVSGSVCRLEVVSYENEEVPSSSTQLSVDENVADSVHNFERWIASRLQCTLRHGDQEWIVSMVDSADNPSLIEINGSDVHYSARLLAETVVDFPDQAAPEQAVSEQIVRTEAMLYEDGVSIGVYRESDLIAASSLVDRNNVIWIDNRVSAEEQILLTTMMLSLILNSWLD